MVHLFGADALKEGALAEPWAPSVGCSVCLL